MSSLSLLILHLLSQFNTFLFPATCKVQKAHRLQICFNLIATGHPWILDIPPARVVILALKKLLPFQSAVCVLFRALFSPVCLAAAKPEFPLQHCLCLQSVLCKEQIYKAYYASTKHLLRVIERWGGQKCWGDRRSVVWEWRLAMYALAWVQDYKHIKVKQGDKKSLIRGLNICLPCKI